MKNVQVNLRRGFLARHVTLRVGKALRPRRWEIQAVDENGWFTTNIEVDGVVLEQFTTRRGALALLDTLPKGRIWATDPAFRPTTYVSHSDTGPGYSLISAAA